MLTQSHCKNESMSLDIVPELVVDGIDLKENVQEHNLDWVDEKSSQTLVSFFHFKM